MGAKEPTSSRNPVLPPASPETREGKKNSHGPSPRSRVCHEVCVPRAETRTRKEAGSNTQMWVRVCVRGGGGLLFNGDRASVFQDGRLWGILPSSGKVRKGGGEAGDTGQTP